MPFVPSSVLAPRLHRDCFQLFPFDSFCPWPRLSRLIGTDLGKGSSSRVEKVARLNGVAPSSSHDQSFKTIRNTSRRKMPRRKKPRSPTELGFFPVFFLSYQTFLPFSIPFPLGLGQGALLESVKRRRFVSRCKDFFLA